MGGLISAIECDSDLADSLRDWNALDTEDQEAQDAGAGKPMTIKDTILFADAGMKTTDPSEYFEIKHSDKIG